MEIALLPNKKTPHEVGRTPYRGDCCDYPGCPQQGAIDISKIVSAVRKYFDAPVRPQRNQRKSDDGQHQESSTNRIVCHTFLPAGIVALDEIAGTPKYRDAMITMGRKFKWQPAPRPYHADDQCVSQIYLELYLKGPDSAMLQPTKQRFDFILAHPANGSLRTEASGEQRRWTWCDALFMAPPAWIRLYKATGDRRYVDFMDQEWWATSDFLYDRSEHLFFRDRSYFDKREANGAKIFWSRGNGWVMAGLARVLPLLPGREIYRLTS
jgi:Glycosyl Hydrolase Family 88